ncbi:retrovirus-related pol polyprotein from transposon TNT 1-94 [Tanacetum coccineum]
MYRSQSPRGNQRNWNNQKSQQLGSNFVMYNKACFVYGSFDHVQANYNYHQREKVVSENNYTRVNYNYFTKKAHPSAYRNMALRAVLMKTGLRPLNTVRPVNTAYPKTTIYSARPMPKVVNIARPNSAVVNAIRANQGHLQKEDQGYVDSGCSRHMTGNMSYLSDFKEFDGGYVLLKVPRKNNMYSVDMKNIVPKESLTCLVAKATLDESMLWHRRLGHVNFKTINKLVKDNLVRGLPSKHFENDQTYVACLKGKQHKASLVTDDYSRFTWVFFLASKDETSGILKSFITEIENLVDKKQNGVAKRRNRTLIEAARTMLADSKLPTIFWVEAVNTACYVHNRVLVVKSHNKTPYELFRGKFDGKLDEGFFVGYSLNSKAFRVYNTKTRKVEEILHIRFLEDKPIITGTNSNDLVGIEESIGTGYSSKETGSSQDYILMPLDAKKKDDEGVNKVELMIIKDLEIILKMLILLGQVLILPVQMLILLDMSNITTTYLVPSTPNTRIHKDHSLDHVIGDIPSGVLTKRMTKASNEQGFISAVYERKTHEDLHTCLFAYFLSQVEPKKVIQALIDPSWIEAMQDELLQFKLQKVWTLVDLPYGKRVIGTKWVYRNKKDERGIVIRNKARLVAQGYTKEERIDYNEVFAPVAKIEAIRLFLAYASFKDFVVYQMDVKSAFLYGKIEEEVYVCQPPGFEDPKFPNRVYKVEKALYGVHQAPRAWYETLSTYLLDDKFQRGQIDKTLFIKRVKGDILLV